MSNPLNAKVGGGTIGGGCMVTVECPKLEQNASGIGFSPCEAEIEVELPAYGGIPVFVDAVCPCCGTVFSENDPVREAIIAAAKDALDNYDGPPEPDMNAVSFSERVELENRAMLRRGW